MIRPSSMLALALALALAACGRSPEQQAADAAAEGQTGRPEAGQRWTMTQGEGEVILSRRQGPREPSFVLTCRAKENVLQAIAENPTGGPVDYSQTVRLTLADQEFQGGPRTVAPGESGAAEQNVLRAEFPLSPDLMAALSRAEEVRIAFGGGEVTAGDGAGPLSDFAGRCAVLTGTNLPDVGPSGEPADAQQN